VLEVQDFTHSSDYEIAIRRTWPGVAKRGMAWRTLPRVKLSVRHQSSSWQLPVAASAPSPP